MQISNKIFWDGLSSDEAGAMATIIDESRGRDWAHPLISYIEANGGIRRENKARLLELRFGYALDTRGVIPSYEVPGEAESTIDFGFSHLDQNWLVEVMRLDETAAIKAANKTWVDKDGIHWFSRILSSIANDETQSEEGETLKAVERICQKCERDGRPHKFPPIGNAYHVILVDWRTFLHGGDIYDKVHVGLGGEYLQNPWYRRFWKRKLISGVFNERTLVRGAREARERVHFLGFVNESTQRYEPGGIGSAISFVANPYLFHDVDEVKTAMATWPFQPVKLLNG